MWDTPLTILFHHLHRTPGKKACEQGHDDFQTISLREIKTAELRTGLRCQLTSQLFQSAVGDAAVRMPQGDLVTLRTEDLLPAFTKHLTLTAALS